MGQSTPISVRKLDNFEELGKAVSGAQREVVQLERGRIRGQLTHLSIGDLPVDIGTFSLGMRSTGILSNDRITLGMLTASTGKVTQWLHDVLPGDVLITPPGDVHDGQYYGGASFAVISLMPAELGSFFGSEPRMQDLASWKKSHFRAAFRSNERLVRRLHRIISQLRDDNTTLSAEATEFWKRSIVEAMTAAVLLAEPSETDRSLVSALKIVGRVEDYLDRSDVAPVHISEICSKLNVSRRTLHRAFHDALGIGPVTFLHRKRLCNVHSILRESDPTTTTIAEIALQNGFLNPGRFSAYYRALFEEYPSQTLGQSQSIHES